MNCPAARHEYRHKAQEQYGRIRFHLGRLCHIGRMIAPNGLRIGDGGALKKRQPNICTNAQ